MRTGTTRLACVFIVIALVAAACGNDDDPSDVANPTTPEAPAADTDAAVPDGSSGLVDCGLNTGQQADGEPIALGSIVGETGGADFSSGADSAAAYFRCVNANGGINGRPIDFIVEDDQWDPEVAGQVATKLVDDDGVVALVASGSFVEMAVNAPFYEESGILSVPSACAVRECFESVNISSVNAGPLPSNNGVVQYALDSLGSQDVSCIGLNIPSNGVWSCEAAVAVAVAAGGSGQFIPLDPGSPDCLGALLEATSGSADTVLTNLPAPLTFCILEAAQEQDLRDDFIWISPTPLYDTTSPAALGDYWDGVVYIQIELTTFDGTGPDNTNWQAVMAEFGNEGDRLDTFSQAGFLGAKIVTDVLLSMDPASIDRESVTNAIRSVSRYDSDLRCSPWYFGGGDLHQSNHSGQIALVTGGGFDVVEDCFVSPGAFIDDVRAFEQANRLGEFAPENFGD